MLLDFNAKKNSKFKFSLGSGQRCVLKDLKLDPEFLSELMPGIPFEVESGVIDQITVHAKLHSIKTEPTVVDIGTVEIVIRESELAAAEHKEGNNGKGDRSNSASKLKNSQSSDNLSKSSSQSSIPGMQNSASSSLSLHRLGVQSSSSSNSTKDCTHETMETPQGVPCSFHFLHVCALIHDVAPLRTLEKRDRQISPET